MSVLERIVNGIGRELKYFLRSGRETKPYVKFNSAYSDFLNARKTHDTQSLYALLNEALNSGYDALAANDEYGHEPQETDYIRSKLPFLEYVKDHIESYLDIRRELTEKYGGRSKKYEDVLHGYDIALGHLDNPYNAIEQVYGEKSNVTHPAKAAMNAYLKGAYTKYEAQKQVQREKKLAKRIFKKLLQQ